MSAIFISHSSHDNVFCQKLINWLDELGHRSVFLDFDENSGIAAGQDWEQKLYKELRVCSAIIVVCTEDLMNSKWCFAEITHARSLGKQIFPIQIAPCVINPILSNAQVVDFINLEEKVAFERLKQGIIKAGIDAKDPYAWNGSRPPYPGLLAFQEEDAAIFFGREKEIREGLDVLTSTYRYGGSGLIMVLGASGSGKSSLVRAGIIPRLKRDPERWLVLNPIQPGEDPFRELAKVLKKAFQNFAKQEYSIDELYSQLQSDLQLAKDFSKKLEYNTQFKNYDVFDKLHEAADLAKATILFTIDQFEELLDRPMDHLGSQFLYFLKSMLHKKESKFIVLGTMRSDFLGMFQQNLALLGLEFGKILVGPVNIESITEIIEKPAELAGVRVEPKLVQGLIEDTRTNDALPLMAFTLRELYDSYSDDNLLEFREYEELGGIHGSVAKSAEGALSKPKLTITQEELLRKAFLQMTRVNEQGNFTRNRVAWNDINPETHEILNRLVSGRLLVSSTDGNDIRTLEVAHESLFRSWKRLKTWLDEDREFLLWRNRLSNALLEWENNNQDKSGLLTGVKLQEASSWMKSHKEQLNTHERLLIDKSINEDIRQKRIKQKRNAILITIAISFLISIFILFINAEKEKTKAQANYLISEANRQAEIDPTLALRLAGEAVKKASANSIILKDAHAIYSEHSFYKVIFKHSNSVNYGVFSPDGKTLVTTSDDHSAQLWDRNGTPIGKPMMHSGTVYSAVFSPNGKTILTASYDNTARLWDLNGNSLGKPMEHSGVVGSAIFSPDGTMILTSSGDHTAHLWDIEGKPIGKPMEHMLAVNSAEFSPDGMSVITTAYDNSARIWDLRGNLMLEDFQHSDFIYSAVFSPDNKRILTASNDGTARIWDLNGNQIGKPINHSLIVYSAIFSPDGQMVLTTSYENSAQLWNLKGQPIGKTMKHAGKINSAVFSPDGRMILTTSRDYTAQIWDLKGHPIGKPMKHSGGVNFASFSPDGKTILTVSNDNSVRLWDLEAMTFGIDMSHNNHSFYFSSINSAVFSPDGKMVLTASDDHTARLWNIQGKLIEKFMKHSKSVNKAVFSPDGKLILTTPSYDNTNCFTASLWNINGEKVGIPIEHPESDFIESAVFSPDGKMILTASSDNTARLWDTFGTSLGIIAKHEDGIVSAVFSPNGKTILTASDDNTAQIWDLKGNPLGNSMNHNGFVNSAVFSPSGDMVLSASEDSTVRLWDHSGKPIGEPIKHPIPVSFATFSPNGKMILSASEDNTARLWNLDGNPIGKPMGKPMEYPYYLPSISFSSDGKLVLTASNDNTAQIWDLNGNPVGKAMEHDDFVSAAVFSSEGDVVLTASGDGTSRLWDIVLLEDFLKSDHLALLTQEQKEKYGIQEESWISKLINKIFSD